MQPDPASYIKIYISAETQQVITADRYRFSLVSYRQRKYSMRRNRIRKRELTQRRPFTNLARPVLLAQPGKYRSRPEMPSDNVEGRIIACIKTTRHTGFRTLGGP
jgi:hypothetical protein